MGTASRITTRQIDALVDAHFRAERDRDIAAIASGFAEGAEHDVAGRPGHPLHGREQIASYYRSLLKDLKFNRFEPVRRWYGDDHVVDASILYATAVGTPFGLPGRERRVLHVFDLAGEMITRESAWLDVAAIMAQLA